MTSPLEVVGHIDIPPEVLGHRFVQEARATLGRLVEQMNPDELVVGTANTKSAELYAWAPNVPAHVDNSGFIYLVALNPGETVISCADAQAGATLAVDAPAGAVIRLDDRASHWTRDRSPRVCAFVGAFRQPCDAEALAILQAGIEALAGGAYYGAPRVSPGFRILAEDERLVPNAAFDECAPMLASDVEARGEYFECCAVCSQPAVVLDTKWPFYAEGNLCRAHLANP